LEDGNMHDFSIGERISNEQFAQFNFGEIILYSGDSNERNRFVEEYLKYNWRIEL